MSAIRRPTPRPSWSWRDKADAAKAAICVFPELSLSAYAIDDLLQQEALLGAVEAGVAALAEASKALYPVLVVGAPLRHRARLYNTAVVIHRGRALGVVPKATLPNYREFYEKRRFTAGANVRGETISLAGAEVPFGVDLIFRSGGRHAEGDVDAAFHVEICEDIWVPVPPSSHAALAGAEVLINLSASNITIGKADVRRLLCASQSVDAPTGRLVRIRARQRRRIPRRCPRRRRRRGLRGHLGAGPALQRGAGGRGDPDQPVGQQHHHRQGRRAPPALRLAVGPRHRRLPLHRRRPRRIHHGPRLGRPGRGVRERCAAGRLRALHCRCADAGRRRRRPPQGRADAGRQLRRQRRRRAARRPAVPHRREST